MGKNIAHQRPKGLLEEFSFKLKKNVLHTQFVHGDPFKCFIAAAGRGGFVDFW
jgi:hypothetical protein